MAYAARILIVVDNKQALAAIEETATAAGVASDKIIVKDEETAAANRETSASFSDMRKGVSLLGTVAFGALAYGMDKSVKAALAWQTQQVSLQQALKNTGQYSVQAMRGVNAATESLATHGGFSDADQLTAMTQLITETGSLTAAQRLNAAATNLARGAHLDYATAVSKVESAMIGQTRGIAKYAGVIVPVTRFTYGWTAAMKAADQAGYAQAVRMNKQATAAEILGMVQKKYGDQTAAYSRTVSGALSNLRNGFEILLRQLGQALLPTVEAVAKAFAGVGEWMTSHMGLVKELAKNILAIALAAAGVVAMYKAWKLWNDAIKAGKALMADNPWLAALMAITVLAALVIANWKAISGAIVSVFNSIGTAVTQVWNGLKSGFVAVVNFISGMINKFIIAPLNSVLSLGGLFGSGPVPTIPMIGGGASSGPSTQVAQAQNSGVPAVQHRAPGGDVHTTIPVYLQIDGRTVAETVVHHVQKRAAMA